MRRDISGFLALLVASLVAGLILGLGIQPNQPNLIRQYCRGFTDGRASAFLELGTLTAAVYSRDAHILDDLCLTDLTEGPRDLTLELRGPLTSDGK
jgi:hypothetical protein